MVLIAQITDTHILADQEAEMREVKTWHSLEKVLAEVKKHQPAALIFTGDIAHEGEKEAYLNFLELANATQISSCWLPGNHDNLEVMSKQLSSEFVSAKKVLKVGKWQILLLNSCFSDAKYGEGIISQEQLDWLNHQLAENEKKDSLFTAIALHHHPVSTGIDWLEQMSVLNASDFHEIINQYPQVKTVFFGHIHHEINVIHNNIQFLGTPATCTQVKPAKHEITAAEIQAWQQPGFRLLELQDDGKLITEVKRIPWFS
ncbi:MAG: phosphodiesterase [Limnothrix sp. RL_2_0]|nr:phosphodiesterase [Limnothrix sp. RL_2_0]